MELFGNRLFALALLDRYTPSTLLITTTVLCAKMREPRLEPECEACKSSLNFATKRKEDIGTMGECGYPYAKACDACSYKNAQYYQRTG